MQACTSITQHSMSAPSQEDPALDQIATTDVPQTAGIGSLPGICDVSDDIMDISSSAQSGQALGAASHAKRAGAMTTRMPTTAEMLPTATGGHPEINIQEKAKVSVTTVAAKAVLMEANVDEVLTAADSAFLNVADAGGNEANAEAMAECGAAYLTEAQQKPGAEAPADPLAPHSIFAADDLISRHPGDFSAAAKPMQLPQVSPLGSPAGGRQAQDAAQDVRPSPTTPLDWAGQSAGSAGSSPTAPAPKDRQLAGFKSTHRYVPRSTPMAATLHKACTETRASVALSTKPIEGAPVCSPDEAAGSVEAQLLLQQQQQSSAERAQRLASQTSGMMGQMQEQLLGGPPAAAEPLSRRRLSDAIGQLLETYGAPMPGNDEVGTPHCLRNMCTFAHICKVTGQPAMGPASGSPCAGQPCVQMCREAAPASKQLRGRRLASPCRRNW